MTVERIEQDLEFTNIATAAPAPRSYWRIVLLTLLTFGLYYGVMGKLVLDWYNIPDFSHGFLVPLFSGYLLWCNRKEILSIRRNPTWWGLPIILIALGCLFVGILGAELFLTRFSLVLMLAGLTIFFWGWARFRSVLFPWAFLFLMIPIPAIIFSQITFPLQLLASKLASSLLPLLGVPVLREGNVIYLPAMPLEVAEACSGIRSLMSLGTLAIIYGYFLETSTWRRIVLAIAAVPIAVAANAARVVGTGLCVQYWDPDKALGFFHEFSGWVIFVVSLFLLYAVHTVLKARPKRAEDGR